MGSGRRHVTHDYSFQTYVIDNINLRAAYCLTSCTREHHDVTYRVNFLEYHTDFVAAKWCIHVAQIQIPKTKHVKPEFDVCVRGIFISWSMVLLNNNFDVLHSMPMEESSVLFVVIVQYIPAHRPHSLSRLHRLCTTLSCSELFKRYLRH